MTTAFQSNAFQSNAFQIDGGPTPTPGREGLGGDDVPRRSPHRGWDKAEWKRRVKEPGDAIEATLREAYAELTGTDAPISVLARVDAIVRPVAKKPAPQEAPQLRINWTALANDYRRYAALMRLRQEERELQAAMDDDDDFMVIA